ncbi:hypothetical protein D9M68_888750 [compost metagenome]
MLMNLWQAIRKPVFLVIQFMIGGQFHKIQFRKHLFHLRTDILIQPVIIINMQKAATGQILSQIRSFLIIKYHISMAGHVNKREVK